MNVTFSRKFHGMNFLNFDERHKSSLKVIHRKSFDDSVKCNHIIEHKNLHTYWEK